MDRRSDEDSGSAKPALVVGHGLVIPGREIRERVSRAGGPGGQRADKVSTRVTLIWDLAASETLTEAQRSLLLARLGPRLTGRGELVVHGRNERHQVRNREEARRRIVELVFEALEPARIRRPTKRTRGSKERRLESKRRQSDTKKGRGRVPHDS